MKTVWRSRRAPFRSVLCLVGMVASLFPLSARATTPTQPVYYDDGREVFVVQSDGTGAAALGVLPTNGLSVLSVVHGLLLYSDGEYHLVQPNGQRQSLVPPTLQASEQIIAAQPSPDGHRVVWQIVAAATLNGFVSTLGLSRIVVTSVQDGSQTTVYTAMARGDTGAVPVVFGWAGSGRLLLQTRILGPQTGLLNRGLQEFSLAIDDLVADDLPSSGSDPYASAQALSLSADQRFVTVATQSAFLPSGEGPLPISLAIFDRVTNRITTLDHSSFYAQAMLSRPTDRIYQYFSAAGGAPIAPDDRHIAYTLVSVTYPAGATHPMLSETAEVMTVASQHKSQLLAGARAVGWLDARTVVLREAQGLYAMNVGTRQSYRLATGAGLHFLGVG